MTIEKVLEEALWKSGSIRDTNRKNLKKIGWDRSSRTDKGVHASKVLLSAKLQVSLADMIDSTSIVAEGGGDKNFLPMIPALVETVNANLPDDVRVFNIAKVNSGFRARDACTCREYSYILPLSLLDPLMVTGVEREPDDRLVSEGKSVELDIEGARELPPHEQQNLMAFDRLLRQFEGCHSFHNFHRLDGRALKAFPSTKQEVEESKMLQLLLDSEDSALTPGEAESLYSSWEPTIRTLTSKLRCNVYACRVQSVGKWASPSGSSESMVSVRIKGQSFLLHQIRLMIGAALMGSLGVLPQESLSLAMLTSSQMAFPMAPAEGLVLMDASFDGNISGQRIAFCRSAPTTEQQEEEASSLSPVSPVDRKEDQPCLLLHPEGLANAERFLFQKIYHQVMHDWFRVDPGSQDLLPMGMSWAVHVSKRYHAPMTLRPKLRSELARVRAIHLDTLTARRDKEFQRSLRSIERARQDLEGGHDYKTPHKAILPNQLSTSLVIALGILPHDPRVARCLRALASAMVTGDLSADLSVDALVGIVVDEGIQSWSERKILDVIK
jgi:tRNA pseudouridine(38-40) synthase